MLKKLQLCKKISFLAFLILSINLNTCLYGAIYLKSDEKTYVNLTSNFSGDEHAANVIYDSSFGMMFDSGGDIYIKNDSGYTNLTSYFNGYAANVIYDSSFGMMFSAPTLIDGKCSFLNNQYILEKPIENLCSQGSPTTAQGFGPWTWSCIGKNGGSNENCIAYLAKENDKNQSIAPIINFLLFNDQDK